MHHWLITVVFVVLLRQLSVADESAPDGGADVSVAISAARDEANKLTIDRSGVFSVVLTNHTDKPLRIWSERCQWGYGTISFRVSPDGKQFTNMLMRPRAASDWENLPPDVVHIAPKSTFTWEIAPSSIWGEREWQGVPEPNTGKPVSLTAVFEIRPSDAAKQQGIWTGRVSSAPLEILFVDPKLRTVHEYLREDCPQQALRIMQADEKQIEVRDEHEQTPLHVAASRGYAEVVRWLLAREVNVNATAYNDFTPLHLTDDPAIARLLLAHKANVNAVNTSGRTALEEAASEFAHWEQLPDYREQRDMSRALAKTLLDGGAQYDIRSACYLGDIDRVRDLVNDKQQALDRNAMRASATYGRTEIVKLLLSRGADPEDADVGGLPVSYFAVQHAAVLKLLFAAGAEPKTILDFQGNGRGPQGSTLLHEAAERGALESAELLLDRGLDVNAKTPMGTTPLHAACRAGHAAVVDLLLKNHANPKLRTNHGATPLDLAASEIHPEQPHENAQYEAVIRSLRKGGVAVDLSAAIAINDLSRVREIIGADPQALTSRNANGRPGLHRAVTLDRREMVKYFLDNGCNPDIRSADTHSGHEGETPLLNAAFWGRLEIAKLLIQSGAKVNATAADGVAPLHEAARMRNVAVARLLMEHGANVNIKDKDGETPLDWAELYGRHHETYELLTKSGGRSKQSK